MVVLEAIKARYNAGKDANMYFFRDSNGMEIDLLQSAGRTLYPMEIKAARTYSKDFTKSIDKFQKLSDKAGSGSVVYAGDSQQKLGDTQLVNFHAIESVVH